MKKLKPFHIQIIIFLMILLVIVFVAPNLRTQSFFMESVETVLHVDDCEKSIDFYENKLGFRVLKKKTGSDNKVREALVVKDDVKFKIIKKSMIPKEYYSPSDSISNRGPVMKIEVDNLATYFQKINTNLEVINLQNKGVNEGSEIAVTDPDGYVVIFVDSEPDK